MYLHTHVCLLYWRRLRPARSGRDWWIKQGRRTAVESGERKTPLSSFPLGHQIVSLDLRNNLTMIFGRRHELHPRFTRWLCHARRPAFLRARGSLWGRQTVDGVSTVTWTTARWGPSGARRPAVWGATSLSESVPRAPQRSSYHAFWMLCWYPYLMFIFMHRQRGRSLRSATFQLAGQHAEVDECCLFFLFFRWRREEACKQSNYWTHQFKNSSSFNLLLVRLLSQFKPGPSEVRCWRIAFLSPSCLSKLLSGRKCLISAACNRSKDWAVR